MNIHKIINKNAKNSIQLIVFKNRRFEKFEGWKYDDVQIHGVNKNIYNDVLKKLNKQGYYKARQHEQH